MSDFISPDSSINVSVCEIMCQVCLLKCQDKIKKESWVVLIGKGNRPSALGKDSILKAGRECLIILLLIALSLMTDTVFGLSA